MNKQVTDDGTLTLTFLRVFGTGCWKWVLVTVINKVYSFASEFK